MAVIENEMSPMDPNVDLSTAAHGAAAALAAAFGLGTEILPSDEWPVEEGDAVIAVELSGDVAGILHLALNDDVARRLMDAPDVLQQGVRGALSAIQSAIGGGQIAAGPAEQIAAGAEVPSHIAAIGEDGALTALVGLTLAMPAYADAAPVAAAPVAAPVAAAPVAHAPAHTPDPASFYRPEQLGNGGHGNGGDARRGRPLAVLHDVDLVVTAELGRTTMPVRELLDLSPGMVVEIDRAAGAPIDLLVNGRRIATGEVVVIDEEFGVRITEILSGDAL